jgi:hypothetical protein
MLPQGSAPIGRLESNQESTRPARSTTGINNWTQKTGPMCISRGLLEPCAHGAGLIVAAYPSQMVAMPRRPGFRKTARLRLHLLGLLGDLLGRLGGLLCLLRFLCHVFLVGLVGLTNARMLRTSARLPKLTRN